MGVLHALRKRTNDPAMALCNALNALAADPDVNIGEKLFNTDSAP